MSLNSETSLGPFLPLLPPASQETIKSPSYGCTMPLPEVLARFDPESEASQIKTAFYCTQVCTGLNGSGMANSDGLTTSALNFDPDSDTERATAEQGNLQVPVGHHLVVSAATLFDNQQKGSAGIHWVSVSPQTRNTMFSFASKDEKEMREHPDPHWRVRETWESEEAIDVSPTRPALYSFDEAKKLFLGPKPVTLVTFNHTTHLENAKPKEEFYNAALHNDHDLQAVEATGEIIQSTSLDLGPCESLMAWRKAAKEKTTLLDRGRIYPEVSMETFTRLRLDKDVRERVIRG
jgi:hypothetical protein